MATFSLNVHLERQHPFAFLYSSQGPGHQRASACVYTTLSALIADSQRLVSKAVTEACNKDLQSRDEKVRHSGSARLKLLAEWQKYKYPFSWDDPHRKGGAKTYKLLTQLFPDGQGGDNPLKRSRNTQMSYSALAKRLVKLGLGSDSNQAPLVRNGIGPTALRLTVPLTRGFLGSEEATHQLWEAGLKALKIGFLPWHKDHANAKTTTSEFWVFIQHSPGPTPIYQVLAEASENDATMAAQQDPSAPWKVPTNISDMGSLWHKKVLPLDWNLQKASLSNAKDHEYVHETYQWVYDNFDGLKINHRLGIVLAIMFSLLLPDIASEEAGGDISRSLPEEELTMKIRELRWTKAKHKGTSETAPFITMMSTTIIAILEKESPLRKYLANNNYNMGNPWTDKHSELI